MGRMEGRERTSTRLRPYPSLGLSPTGCKGAGARVDARRIGLRVARAADGRRGGAGSPPPALPGTYASPCKVSPSSLQVPARARFGAGGRPEPCGLSADTGSLRSSGSVAPGAASVHSASRVSLQMSFLTCDFARGCGPGIAVKRVEARRSAFRLSRLARKSARGAEGGDRLRGCSAGQEAGFLLRDQHRLQTHPAAASGIAAAPQRCARRDGAKSARQLRTPRCKSWAQLLQREPRAAPGRTVAPRACALCLRRRPARFSRHRWR